MAVMAYIGRVLAFGRKVTTQSANVNTCQTDVGGGVLRTTDHMTSMGDDSPPLADDYVLAVKIPRSEKSVSVACADTRNAGVAEPGEKRVYSRDSDGAVVAEIHLKGDGVVVVKNDSGSIELAVDGTVTINESVTIDTSGNINTPGTITSSASVIGGIDFAGHTHPGVQSGGSSTGVPQ